MLSQGYDDGDEYLSGENIGQKYKGDTLKQKSNSFVLLAVEKQRDELYKILTRKDNLAPEKSTEGIFVDLLVNGFLAELKKLDKLNEWIKRSIPYNEYLKLPIEEKKKYHNALVKFHDKCKGQPESKRILASSPAVTDKGCPDFDDKSKWEEIK